MPQRKPKTTKPTTKSTTKSLKSTNTEPAFEKRRLQARTPNQQALIDTIDENLIVLCSGPAGSGKTYIMVAKAIEYLQKGLVKRIIIARPAVESQESLGAIPGSAFEKVAPFLVPIFEELKHFVSHSDLDAMKNAKQLEVVPLAHIRGRNFNDAFIIIDESQNCTLKQLLAILTRIGKDSKLVLSGDITQSDLHRKQTGGFDFCMERLVRIEGIGIVQLTRDDIVRHPLIAKILERLEE